MKLSSVLTIVDKPKHKQVALARSADLQKLHDVRIDAAAFCWQAMPDEVFGVKERRLMKRELMHDRKAWLAETLAASKLDPNGLTQNTVWTNDIAEWVCTAAGKHGNDMVLKAVHPSRTLVHTPLDWQLLDQCPVPLMLTSTRSKRKKSRIILAAIDLTKLDAPHLRLNRKVLDAATFYAERTGSVLHCVYVVELSSVLRDLDIISEREAKKRAIKKTQAAVQMLVDHYPLVKSRIHFPVGKVGQEVQQLGFRLKADLLVMGTYVRRFKQTIGIGNSAQKVLSRLPCDVLAVHP